MKKLMDAFAVIGHAKIDYMPLQFPAKILPDELEMTFESILLDPARDIAQLLPQRLFTGFHLDSRKATAPCSWDVKGKSKEIKTPLLFTFLKSVSVKFNTLRFV